MEIFYRIVVLIILALLAGPLYALTINILIMADTFPSDSLDTNLGQQISLKATYIWLASLVPAVASLFIKQKWRKILLALPLIAPSLFAVLYSLSM